MPKKSKINRFCTTKDYCNDVANQYLLLVTIFAAIISNEIEDDEELGILGSFFVAVGEEIALASETRIACKAKFKDEGGEEGVVENVFDRGIHTRPNKVRKVVRRTRKRISKSSYEE